MPIGFAFGMTQSKYSWSYDTVPQKEFEKVTVTEPESVVVDSAGGTHKMPSEIKNIGRVFSLEVKP